MSVTHFIIMQNGEIGIGNLVLSKRILEKGCVLLLFSFLTHEETGLF